MENQDKNWIESNNHLGSLIQTHTKLPPSGFFLEPFFTTSPPPPNPNLKPNIDYKNPNFLGVKRLMTSPGPSEKIQKVESHLNTCRKTLPSASPVLRITSVWCAFLVRWSDSKNVQPSPQMKIVVETGVGLPLKC